MKNIIFGVLETDSYEVSYYLKSGTNLSYKTYSNITDLYNALDKTLDDAINEATLKMITNKEECK